MLSALEIARMQRDRVLIADWFIYWGGDGPKIPVNFIEDFVQKGIGHRSIEDELRINEFLAWASSQGEAGVTGDLCEWKFPPKKKKKLAAA